METEFATFEISKTLKELGYNEKGFGCYYVIPESEQGRLMFHDVEFDCDSKIKAPMYQQIKKWLWDEHRMTVCVDINREKECHCCVRGYDRRIIIPSDILSENWEPEFYDSPITAEREGIKKTIEYLSKK